MIQWKLWVGAKMGYIDLTEAPLRTLQILDTIAFTPYLVDDCLLCRIRMHGQPIGIGVEVAKLCWNADLGLQNVFDFQMVEKAKSLVPKLEKLFGDLGLHAQILVMHHIDLGRIAKATLRLRSLRVFLLSRGNVTMIRETLANKS